MDLPVRDDDYLYSIQSDPFYYYARRTPDGTPMLVVLQYPCIVTVSFDKAGDIMATSEKPLSEETRGLVQRSGFYRDFLQAADQEITSHLADSGFAQDTIKVKRFFLPRYHIGIRDFPE